MTGSIMATATTSNPIIKTINRVLGRGKSDPVKAIQKAIPFSSGGGYNYPFGYFNQSADITFSKLGATAAFTMVYEVNCCIQSIANGINYLDWNVVRYKDGVRKGETGEIIANRRDLRSRHPLHQAFQIFGHEYKTTFTRLAAIDYSLYGEFFIERVSNTFGSNRSIEWLNPLGVNVQYTKEIDWIQYGWNMDFLQIPPERVAYLHNYNPNCDFVGLPTALTVLDEINIARNLDRFLRDHFINNARPGVIISPTTEENRFSDVDYRKLLEKIRNQLKGVGGQYSTLVMQIPIKADVFDQPDIAKNTTLNEQQSIAIFEAFGVPRAMRGNTSVSPYKSGDEISERFYRDGVLPLATGVIQPFINTELMPFFDSSGDTIFEFDTSPFDEITQADMLEAQVVDIQTKGTLIDLYSAAEKQEIQPDEKLKGLYLVNGVPVPIDELSTYWEKTLLVSPSVYNAPEITGEPLPAPTNPQSVIPTEEGGEPAADETVREELTETSGEEVPKVEEISQKHDHNRLPHYKLYAGDKLFPSEDVIEERLAKELHAWKRFEIERFAGRKNRTRDFVTNTLPPWVRNEIIDRLDEVKNTREIKAAFDTVLDDPVIKSLTSYQRGLREFGRGLWNDSITIGQFMSGMEDMIEREFNNAFTLGVHKGGLTVSDLTPEEKGEIDTLIENEIVHIDDLAHFIYRNRKGVGKLDAIRSRVDMWVARYSRAKEVGYLIAKRAEPLLWQYDPRKDHCRSCAALNGQVRRAEYWRKVGIEPNSDRLECYGIWCGCRFLEPAENAPLSRGRLPRAGWRY